ncbi:MAG TPA: hypothetical protein VJ343_00380 [archaeon]|nr:hypothetical protein [archaeon]
MNELMGLALSFFGFILLAIGFEARQNPIFEFSMVLGVPMTYFGLRMLIGI